MSAPNLRDAALQALETLEYASDRCDLGAWGDDVVSAINALHAALAQPAEPGAWRPLYAEPPAGWSVFNTGAEVVGGVSLTDALDYLTPSRLARGWCAVCVINKDNAAAFGLSLAARGGAA